MKYLLDVNALIAAIWTDHVHHAVVDAWIKGKPLATNPLTELGFLRVSTHPKALGATMAEARKLLRDFITQHKVEFVAADLPALDSKASKSEEVTDAYLADLANRKNLKLATLDQAISHSAVEVIGENEG
jgi:toxin-antitoxin system PIN domain toxin